MTSRSLWELVGPLISDGPDAFLILDDSVQDKRYSRFIELVKRQYSGAEHGLVRGIGIVNLVHSTGGAGDFWPLDFPIYAPDADGKTKNEHFREMLLRAVADKRLQARTILFDSWYAAADNRKTHPAPQPVLLHHTEGESVGQLEQGRRLHSFRTRSSGRPNAYSTACS